ncbi:MAG: undecaprenyl-diphosphatase, partial [Candidatus Desulfofervidaceae bacterium]|nr:undecaprenyl-diphosphatase [Candidatus Desulfofervidaceae bacterium]
TISAGVYLGLTGETAGRFSFLIAIPAIFGAGVLELKNTSTLPSGLFIPYIAGFLSSFLAGFWAIRWLLKILARTQNKLVYFAYYCWVIGLIFFWLV